MGEIGVFKYDSTGEASPKECLDHCRPVHMSHCKDAPLEGVDGKTDCGGVGGMETPTVSKLNQSIALISFFRSFSITSTCE